ncbi:hypothetical protein NLJ89_g10961 [Agrocybe chaxingu]|uniref:BTB domain-containing protein n=1 Tax=Agrocybe chaxingu TaxID=84603 RepID=A0A9W8MQE8_9AGAR|nr:hypothetical protein NLJ89_g10961 [Agrocybe chaxingu]
MAEATLNSQFYWDNIVIQVEDELFCVPRCEFVRSSEVFADMFLLPSGPAACHEGQDRKHPIVLEGYKKHDFACLLKVMYPTAGSLISGTKLDLDLEKKEWASVLKLSAVWNMKKIRAYAIHRLSTDISLSAIEKVILGRAHKVGAWLEEGLCSLVSSDYRPTLADLGTLGWETAAQILWIRDTTHSPLNVPNTLRFTRDAIKCGFCSSPSSLINFRYNCYNCGQPIPPEAELTFSGPGSATTTADRLITLKGIECNKCGRGPFKSLNVHCNFCSRTSNHGSNVRIMPNNKDMIEEIFGEEIEDYKSDIIDV